MAKKRLVGNLQREEVKKMKNLIVIIAALAMVLSFLPMAEAGEPTPTANLGLEVTFAKNEPLVLYTKPEGPFKVEEGSLLEFKVIAQDPDALTVRLEALALPDGATFELDDIRAMDNHKRGTFKWTPKEGQGKDEPYKAEFKAKSTGASYSDYEEKDLSVSITVRPAPIIAIELTPTTWVLERVKLGEMRNNKEGGIGFPIHTITNNGNVPVDVDIGYGPQTQEYPSVRPGLEQGKDTFITKVMETKPGAVTRSIPQRDFWREEEVVLPPDERKLIAHKLLPAQEKKGTKKGRLSLLLKYGAPTELSEGIQNHVVTYELRAYFYGYSLEE